jgi:hypothetical protein
MCHHVLSHSDGIFKVEHCMPDASRDEDCLSWPLNELKHIQLLHGVFLLNFGKNLNEIVDGLVLVVFSPELLALRDRFGDRGTKSHPTFIAGKGSVPGRGVKGVGVHRSAGPFRTDDHPD